MYNMNELLERMKAGESAESIAAEMTSALNAASKEYEEVVAAEKAKQANAAKKSDMGLILDAIIDFLRTYYPGLCKDATGSLSNDDKAELYDVILNAILEALDETAGTSKRSMDPMTALLMAGMLDGFGAPAPKKKSKSEDDILADFLGKICH